MNTARSCERPSTALNDVGPELIRSRDEVERGSALFACLLEDSASQNSVVLVNCPITGLYGNGTLHGRGGDNGRGGQLKD